MTDSEIRADLIFRDICGRAYEMRANEANERAVRDFDQAAEAIAERDAYLQRAAKVRAGEAE
jgi:hypothetical protein